MSLRVLYDHLSLWPELSCVEVGCVLGLSLRIIPVDDILDSTGARLYNPHATTVFIDPNLYSTGSGQSLFTDLN